MHVTMILARDQNHEKYQIFNAVVLPGPWGCCAMMREEYYHRRHGIVGASLF